VQKRSVQASPASTSGKLSLDPEPARSLLELVSGALRPVLILGSPGSGKSFFLRWCALKACQEPGSSPPFFDMPGAIPVFISLAAVGLMPGRLSLEDYAAEVLLAEGLDAGHLLGESADQGRALFLLDGLDEVGEAGARRSAWASVAALARRFPRSRIIVTSRPGGIEEIEPADLESLGFEVLSITPLSDATIRALLVRWCDRYEPQREGTEASRRSGSRDGEELANQVLASAPVHELATSPLLATVVAIVHRAGVRLPNSRVELHEHALKILVERWNQVRLRSEESATPLRLADAIQLLGPVALEIINGNREGAIDEETLSGMLRRALAAGNVRGLSDAGAALEMFRSSLGLLVERAPGVYGFLHQTFIEFLAAHELLRTDQFLSLVKSPRDAYASKWHEVISLGAGILGVLQANDEELDSVVRALVSGAGKRRGKPSVEVPRLLGALLADDLALSKEMTQLIAHELSHHVALAEAAHDAPDAPARSAT
jgi:predicted NACHT family NTPase